MLLLSINHQFQIQDQAKIAHCYKISTPNISRHTRGIPKISVRRNTETNYKNRKKKTESGNDDSHPLQSPPLFIHENSHWSQTETNKTFITPETPTQLPSSRISQTNATTSQIDTRPRREKKKKKKKQKSETRNQKPRHPTKCIPPIANPNRSPISGSTSNLIHDFNHKLRYHRQHDPRPL